MNVHKTAAEALPLSANNSAANVRPGLRSAYILLCVAAILCRADSTISSWGLCH